MNLPKVPRNNLEKVDYLHGDFINTLFSRHADQKLDSTLCRRIATNVHYAMEEDVSVSHVFQTLMQYEGRQLTPHWRGLLARQLVARARELEVGPLQLFDRPIRDEWVAMEIYDIEPCVWRDNQRGVLISFYCLNGHPAGHILQKKFPEGWISFMAYRIGFSRKFNYQHEPEELVGMRFWGYLLAARKDPTDLDFDDWKVDTKFRKGNQSIIKLRQRFDVEPHRIPEDKEYEYSCPIDSDEYCSDCSCSVTECLAAYNRERTNVRRSVVGR